MDALRRALESATAFAAYETNGPMLRKSVERAATAVLMRERAAGRIRDFRVRCDDALNPPGSDGVTFEVTIVPPGPRAQAVVLRLSPV